MKQSFSGYESFLPEVSLNLGTASPAVDHTAALLKAANKAFSDGGSTVQVLFDQQSRSAVRDPHVQHHASLADADARAAYLKQLPVLGLQTPGAVSLLDAVTGQFALTFRSHPIAAAAASGAADSVMQPKSSSTTRRGFHRFVYDSAGRLMQHVCAETAEPHEPKDSFATMSQTAEPSTGVVVAACLASDDTQLLTLVRFAASASAQSDPAATFAAEYPCLQWNQPTSQLLPGLAAYSPVFDYELRVYDLKALLGGHGRYISSWRHPVEADVPQSLRTCKTFKQHAVSPSSLQENLLMLPHHGPMQSIHANDPSRPRVFRFQVSTTYARLTLLSRIAVKHLSFVHCRAVMQDRMCALIVTRLGSSNAVVLIPLDVAVVSIPRLPRAANRAIRVPSCTLRLCR